MYLTVCIIYKVSKNCFLFFSLVITKNIKLSQYSSDNLPVTVGGTVGASVILVVGVIFAMFAARYDEMNACAKKKRQRFEFDASITLLTIQL